jgi:hypothetical protein
MTQTKQQPDANQSERLVSYGAGRNWGTGRCEKIELLDFPRFYF